MPSDDVRARRAERLRKQKLKEAPKKALKIAAIVVALAAVGAVAWWAATNAPSGPRFAHEHPALAIFVDGERINLRDPVYDYGRTQDLRSHMHVTEPDGGSTWHIEGNFRGGIPDITMASALERLGILLRSGHLRMNPDAAHGPIEVRDGGNATLRLFYARILPDRTYGDPPNWAPVEDYVNFVPRHGYRILVTFGNQTGEELAAMLTAAMNPPIAPENLSVFASPETPDGPLVRFRAGE
ncbi:MAG TPA: hypothetical protein VM681_03060 [Candidatus Thermoplasmatota archaeon]|nr:hypothetical protein [Candidatus Thermoplasmatota archaeon]